jgi:predicted nucleic acid-binding protein
MLLIDLGGPPTEVEVPSRYGLRDVNDNMVFETAIYGAGDYLVTHDRDLLELRHHVAQYIKNHHVAILRDTRVIDDENGFLYGVAFCRGGSG